MLKKIIILLIMTIFTTLFATNITIKFKNGKTISGEIKKIEAAKYDGSLKMETSYITLASGTSELRTQIKNIKSIKFVKSGDISCFEDSRFAPVRKFCTQKSQYTATLKKKGKRKNKIEVIDDRKFIITLKNQKEPIQFFIHKIKLSNAKQQKKTYNDLTQEVLKLSKDGIKEITFK